MPGASTPIHLISRALAERNILGPPASATGLLNLEDHFSAIEGPWLIAAVLQSLLMGILVVQSYDYFGLYKTDGKWLRGMVGGLVVVNLVCTVTDISVIYRGFITHFGNYEALLLADPVQLVNLNASPVVAAIVQAYFAWRSFKVNRSIIIAVLMASLILLSLGAWIAVAVLSQTTAQGFGNVAALLISVQLVAWSAVAADLILSVVFIYHMAQANKGFSPVTDHIVSRLLAMSIGTAGVTTVVAMVNALSFALNNTTSSFWIIPNFTIARVYTISLLYVLNSRRALRLVAEGNNTSTGDERGGSKPKSRFGRGDAVGGINVHLGTFVAQDSGHDSDVGEKRTVRF